MIASSGVGKVEHFSDVFERIDMEGALAEGLFNRQGMPIEAVNKHMRESDLKAEYKFLGTFR